MIEWGAFKDNLYVVVVVLLMLSAFGFGMFWFERLTGIHDSAVLGIMVRGGLVALLIIDLCRDCFTS